MTLMPLQREDPDRIGRYRLTARLGAGGMGVVYLGEADDGQKVAVKVLRPECADDGETRGRFRREVQAMLRVRNQHIARVLDADPGCRRPYLAAEFADGPSLEEHVEAYGPMHPEGVVRLASALAEALAAIHAAGVTHRDLKPSNVLLTPTGPKVIDFGIAKTASSVAITRTGMAVGSPGYMAPEQVTGHGRRESDIFAWALVVAFASSGRPPFGTGQALEVMHRIMTEAPDISDVPPRLTPLVTNALAADPARRPTAADLVRDLAPDAAAAIEGPVPGLVTTAAEYEEAAGSGSRRRRVAAVALPAAAILAALGGVLAAEGGTQPGIHAPVRTDARPAHAPRSHASHAGPYSGSVAGTAVADPPTSSSAPASSSRPAPRPSPSSVSTAPSVAPSPSSSAPSSSPASSSSPPSSSPPSSSPASSPPASLSPSSSSVTPSGSPS